MFVNVKVGKRGEIVIPAAIRKAMGITPDSQVGLRMGEKSIEITAKNPNIVEEFRKMAMKCNMPAGKLIIGDALYEEGM